MIPHIPGPPSFPENGAKTISQMRRARPFPAASQNGSAELFAHERGHPSTELFGLCLGRRLRENANDGLRPGRSNEDPRLVAQTVVQAPDVGEQPLPERAALVAREVFDNLWIADHR